MGEDIAVNVVMFILCLPYQRLINLEIYWINVLSCHFIFVCVYMYLINLTTNMHNMYFSLLFQAPSIDEKVDLHFIALVHVDGHLYELGKNYLNLFWGGK